MSIGAVEPVASQILCPLSLAERRPVARLSNGRSRVVDGDIGLSEAALVQRPARVDAVGCCWAHADDGAVSAVNGLASVGFKIE